MEGKGKKNKGKLLENVGGLRKSTKNSLAKRMSLEPHEYYNNLWSEAHMELREMIGEEKRREVTYLAERSTALSFLSDVFYKYLKLYKKLDETYDQMVHPQKRLLVRQALDLALSRLLEIREALVATEHSEFHYLDELAYAEGLTPEDLDIPPPRYYTHDPDDVVLEKESWLRKFKEMEEAEELRLLEEKAQGLQEPKDLTDNASWMMMEEDEEAIEEAIHIIQIYERYRQGKMRYNQAIFYKEEVKRAQMKKQKAKMKRMDSDKAAIIIQKLVRGFLARRKVAKLRGKELDFLGVKWSTYGEHPYQKVERLECERIQKDLQEAEEKRRELRRRYNQDYEDAKVMIKKHLQILEGPQMAEMYKYQIRNWMLEVKEKKGKFPAIPDTEFGGSKFFICPESLSEETFQKGREATDPEYAKMKKQERAKEKEKKKQEKAKEKKGTKKAEASVPKLEVPKNIEEMMEVNKEYNMNWRGRDERDNPEQRYEDIIIINEKRLEVSEEVRNEVDEVLRLELDQLRQILEKKKKKGKKGKKGKGKGKKGKKKGKDLTPDRTMESLFHELYAQDIIKDYSKISLKDIIGDPSLINGEIRSFHADNLGNLKDLDEIGVPGDQNPLPTIGDIKKALKDICILPFGSPTVAGISPKTKSVLLAGPVGSGKKTLVRAVASELRATLMDLTAENLGEKYPEKSGLKMLVHLLYKVGRAVAPTIIMIDKVERTYMKKAPKIEHADPKRLKKQIGKFLKSLGPEDRVLLIGITSEPWSIPMPTVKKDFNRVLYIPLPDYGSRVQMWKKILTTYGDEISPDVNVSLLAKLSENWTLGRMDHVVKQAVNALRAKNKQELTIKEEREEDDMVLYRQGGKKVIIGKKRLRLHEICSALSNVDPIFVEQNKAFNTWFNKTPLQKARLSNQVMGDQASKEAKKKK